MYQTASPQLARVVSVLALGDEDKPLDFDNLDLKRDLSLRNAKAHAITMTDFAFEELAQRFRDISFIHAFPDFVKSGF